MNVAQTKLGPARSAATAHFKPELLAPAGDWECAKAAVENGADAIYFGLERFNARMRAHNFTEADLPRLMEFLHVRGVKGYVTFNTLVFADEMDQARDYLKAIITAGVDAAIVQDVGICRLIRQLSPDFPIHASTQMTITSATGVAFARELGCNLVVLARECSLKEIEKIQAAESANAEPVRGAALPLEVFVHGALCVAYSGQCLTSEALGGRSANRGECAQACRMPYQLISDNAVIPLGDKKYLLSPQDLAGLPALPELVRLGVTSLKIEGRLKTPEYVANITRVYRRAVDAVTASATKDFENIRRESRYDMEMAFSRGLHTGWFNGINNQELVHARFGKKRGVFLGEVARVEGQRVVLQLESALKPGDGVVFDAGQPEQPEEGGRVYTVASRGSDSVLSFGHGELDFSRIHPGHKLWKTSDPVLDKEIRKTFDGEQPRFLRSLNFEVHGRSSGPLTVFARDEEGRVAQVESAMPLTTAETKPLGEEKLREQLGRLGGTPFQLGELKNHIEGSVMLPVSELNRIRRDLVTQVTELRARPLRWKLNSPAPQTTHKQKSDAAKSQAELIVLVRNLDQLQAALKCGVQTLYCEFEDIKKYREAVSVTRCAGGCAEPNRTIWVAPPRIFKMGEDWILQQVKSCGADGYLARNYDHLKYFHGERIIGDYSLNVANALTAEYFRENKGLERVTASYDLNFSQLEALLRASPPEWFEVTIHQHMPMFHMEHCVFCAFLSAGTDYTNCGRPCDQHNVKLRDRVGAEHPLKADAGCRNTVFNALAQTGAEYVARMLALGVRKFRAEFLNETPDVVAKTIAKYRQLLRGEVEGAALWRDLKLNHQLGVTRGQMGQ